MTDQKQTCAITASLATMAYIILRDNAGDSIFVGELESIIAESYAPLLKRCHTWMAGAIPHPRDYHDTDALFAALDAELKQADGQTGESG